MTRLRRVLHRLGWHWWSQWYRYNFGEPNGLFLWDNGKAFYFERRFCCKLGCETEQRRVREAE